MTNPYAPPAAPPNPGFPQSPYGELAWAPPVVDGDRLTIAKVATWPPLCVKCGTSSDLRARVRKYAWVPRWTYFLFALGLLPALIAQMATMKRATLTHAICGPCNSRWTTARVAYSASVLLTVLGGMAVFILGANVDSGVVMAAGGLLFFPGIAIFPVAAHYGLVRKATLLAEFIDDRDIRLWGVAPQVLEAFRSAWPAGRGH